MFLLSFFFPGDWTNGPWKSGFDKRGFVESWHCWFSTQVLHGVYVAALYFDGCVAACSCDHDVILIKPNLIGACTLGFILFTTMCTHLIDFAFDQSCVLLSFCLASMFIYSMRLCVKIFLYVSFACFFVVDLLSFLLPYAKTRRLKAARSAAKAATSLAKGQPLSQAWSHCFTVGAKDWSDKIQDRRRKIPGRLGFKMCVTELPLVGVWTGKIFVVYGIWIMAGMGETRVACVMSLPASSHSPVRWRWRVLNSLKSR